MPRAPRHPAPLAPIPFLNRKPTIDGLPKPEIDTLPTVALPVMFRSAPDAPAPIPATLRLAYGAEFLFLQVQFAADRLVERDRGYQFGDGLIVTIAEPQEGDAPSERYYLMGFSHQRDPRTLWARSVLWEHDCKTQLAPLGREVEVAAAASDGVARLDVAIPWSSLHPYHPWLSEAIGLNACFVKAIGDRDADYYALLHDEAGEEMPKKSTRLTFADPSLSAGHQFAVVADGRIAEGETLRARTAVLAADSGEVHLSARIRSGEGDPVLFCSQSAEVPSGLTRRAWDVATDGLLAGGYRVDWRSGGCTAESHQGLSVLPNMDGTELLQRVELLSRALPPGDAATVAFEAEQIRSALQSLAPARTVGLPRLAIERLLRDCARIETAHNPIAERTGTFRRAFRSRIDGTLQPFSVHIPRTYTKSRAWPLLVTFHGSGVDDVHYMRSIGTSLFPEGMLVAAPLGRGVSHGFTQGKAQEDVAEAVSSMSEAYAVDRDRVLLMGFSMGAYGALRTYIEEPERYRAIAVFCTPPAFPVEGETHPDFTEPKCVEALAGAPVFVFHGRRDNSAPFANAERMVAALRQAGARVTFIIEDDAGHDVPSAQTLKTYSDWANSVLDV